MLITSIFHSENFFYQSLNNLANIKMHMRRNFSIEEQEHWSDQINKLRNPSAKYNRTKLSFRIKYNKVIQLNMNSTRLFIFKFRIDALKSTVDSLRISSNSAKTARRTTSWYRNLSRQNYSVTYKVGMYILQRIKNSMV